MAKKDDFNWLMKDLNYKLLTIDYSKDFVSQYKCPPIHRFYFTQPINQAQQFFTFCCLSSYLINRLSNNANSFKVDSFDDPNVTIDKILRSISQHGIDIQSKFQADIRQKLKLGYGLEVTHLLNGLIDRVWAIWLQDNPSTSSNIKIVVKGTDGQTIDTDIEYDEEDMEHDLDDNEIELEEEFEDYLQSDSEFGIEQGDSDEWPDDSLQDRSKKMMMLTQTDLDEWKLELERVLPQLNVSISNHRMFDKSYDNEWRIHLQAARLYHATIETLLEQTDGMLQIIKKNLAFSLEKIKLKENYLHQNADTILAEWTNVRQRAMQIKQAIGKLNGEINLKTVKLQQLNDDDRETKQLIEDFSLRMTDSSPLTEAKKARELLKTELTRINLQIGVAIQTLVRHVTHPNHLR